MQKPNRTMLSHNNTFDIYRFNDNYFTRFVYSGLIKAAEKKDDERYCHEQGGNN